MAFGRLRLLPYDRGLRSSADLPNISKQDQDRILGAYSDRKNRRVQFATLVEIGEWHAGEPLSRGISEDLYRAAAMLAFAAIAKRVLFSGGNYINATHYGLVVQAFEAGRDGFAFNARRRDGSSSNYWSRDQFGFQRPLHAQPHSAVDVDAALLHALLQVAAGDPLLEAITEFNSANSDSADVAPHVELVMCNSALEWLSGLRTSKGLFDSLGAWFPKDRARVGSGPMKQRWIERWKPRDDRVLLAWARDFSALRGMSAHANQRSSTLWSHFSHLAFLSLLVPAVVKIILEERSLYQRTQGELDEAAGIENYLLYDPRALEEDGRSAWSSVRSGIRLHRISAALRNRDR